jgi:hypothetical protein
MYSMQGMSVIMFNDTFNNILVISWGSVLLVEDTGENHQPVASHWQTLSHNIVSSTSRHERDLNSQLWWWYALIAQVVVNSTTIRSRPRRPPMRWRCYHLVSHVRKCTRHILTVYGFLREHRIPLPQINVAIM